MNKEKNLTKKKNLNLIKFFFKNGSLKKYFLFFSDVSKNFFLNIFFGRYLKKNFFQVLPSLVNLIKPPFLVKITSVPKKLKKKVGLRYFLKVTYKSEIFRLKTAFKYLQNFTNDFNDSKYKYRLYKVFYNTWVQWKSSKLYKLKLLTFSKFLKI